MLSAVGARHLSIGTLAFAGTNGALKDETRPPAYRMVAYADHGVVVFDRPDDTTKQHWPRHRARARVVYCSRPPNTHLITQTSTHPPHSSDGTTSFKFPHRTGVPSTFSLHLSGSFCSDKTQHSTHSLTHLVARCGDRTRTRGASYVYGTTIGRELLSSLVMYTTHLQTTYSRGHARRSSRRPNLHSGRWV